jgi:hypothetical protein
LLPCRSKLLENLPRLSAKKIMLQCPDPRSALR